MENNNGNEGVIARRRALAEALKMGTPVVVTPTGEVSFQEEAQERGLSTMDIPDGKLA